MEISQFEHSHAQAYSSHGAVHQLFTFFSEPVFVSVGSSQESQNFRCTPTRPTSTSPGFFSHVFVEYVLLLSWPIGFYDSLGRWEVDFNRILYGFHRGVC